MTELGGKRPIVPARILRCTYNPDVQALLDALRALERHLARFDALWASNVRLAADEVAKSDAHGLRRFLGFFGGVGSLNDLVLQRDGAILIGENDQLEVLRGRAWSIADQLRHEQG